MKRRDVLKRLGIASGAIIATPTILSMLNACTAEPKVWTPRFLTISQGKVLQDLVDVFLPETAELPSAKAVNIPEFIDRYVAEIYVEKDQEIFKSAFENTLTRLKNFTDKDPGDITNEDLKIFLDEHLKVKGEIDTVRGNNPNFDGMTTSEFLDSLKWFTINAYLNSEKIGEEVLAYDPIPGAYHCGDLNELTGGKRWSLS